MPIFRRRSSSASGARSLRLYYASDIHGTEVLWRKFLHAPRVYEAPVIVMGGDVTGKAVIPLVQAPDGVVTAELFGQPERAGTPEERAELEHRIRSNGMYPHLMSADEVQRVAALHQPVEEFPQQRRRAVGRHRVEVQLRLAVEVPGEDGDRALGAQRRLVERLEVIGRVDEEGDALGARHRPAVVAGAQDRRRAVRRLDARGGGCRAFASHAAVEIQHAAHYVTRTLAATHRAPKGAGVVAPVAAGALVVGVANGAGVCAAVPLVIGAVGPRFAAYR